MRIMLRSAFLGCGPRARAHAAAYAGITRAEIVAICDLDTARLDAFGEQFGVVRRYTDAAEMLERERPHLLHIVTVPRLRVPLMTLASEHGVPAAVVE
jgi:predicted dehydrogenase